MYNCAWLLYVIIDMKSSYIASYVSRDNVKDNVKDNTAIH